MLFLEHVTYIESYAQFSRATVGQFFNLKWRPFTGMLKKQSCCFFCLFLTPSLFRFNLKRRLSRSGVYIHRPVFSVFHDAVWKRHGYLWKHCAAALRRAEQWRCFMTHDTRGLTIGIASRFNALVCLRVFVIDAVASVSQE